MAKRKAESLLALLAPPYKRLLGDHLPHAPVKRKMDFVEERTVDGARLSQRPRSAAPTPPSARSLSVDGGLKRPRVDTGGHNDQEAAPDPGAEGESRRRGSTEPRRRSLYGSQDQQDGEECWQYNSFHYWRVPLPNIDFSDILQLDVDNLRAEFANTGAEGTVVEMES
ncbi:uncharacterized protein C9orf40 homolog [Ambystoma mexicanum]|uniref:uncharacterized protein C9orf40 homolog n=1 Tax=Ambystoma mexicanum TaxID=8296 RepID=UPI0037E8F84F